MVSLFFLAEKRKNGLSFLLFIGKNPGVGGSNFVEYIQTCPKEVYVEYIQTCPKEVLLEKEKVTLVVFYVEVRRGTENTLCIGFY